MMLQTGRYLINCYRDAKAGVPMPSSVAYMDKRANMRNRRSAATTSAQLVQLDALLETYDVVCAHLVTSCGEQYDRHVAAGLSTELAYEECGTWP